MVSVAKPTNGPRVWSAAILVVALLGASLGAVAAPPEPADEGLFSEAAATDGSDAKDDPTIVRSRLVTIDFARLGAPDESGLADRLVLNFFPDAVYTAIIEQVERNPSGSFSWIGHLEGVELSQVVLVVRDGVMMGNVVAPGMFYQVRYVGDGVHAVREADQAAFPSEAPPVPVDLPAGDVAQPTGPADDGSIIDVLVVYTDDVLAYYGGNTTSVETMIDLAVSETNAGYGNSGITQRVNLVHTEMISYDESGFDWNTTLSRFSTHGDGYFDTVTQPTTGLRDTYLADESVLIVSQSYSSICGLGYMMSSVNHSFEALAFVVVARNCATGYYSFGHEMGHNMGAHHDWYVNTSTAPYPYNHGFVNYPDRWRTIMAYNWRCSDYETSCTRLNYWSNPDVPYGGDPMGVVTTGPTDCNYKSLTPDPSTCAADNRTVLNNTAYTVANFRVSNHPPHTPGSPVPADGATEQDPDVNLSWTGGDPDAGDTVTYDVYFRNSASSYTQICDDATTLSCDPGALALNAHYYWYVVATDSHSESTTGPEWDFYTITNAPPNTPSNPSPADGATGQSFDVDLFWTGGDPDIGDTVTYDVYFRESASTFARICDDVTTPSCDPGTLALNAHYYWYVVAFDSHGVFTVGPTWEFYAISNDPPHIPGFPLPADGAMGESVDVELAWTGGDPDAGDTVTYTVYLDTSSPPGIGICHATATTCDPPGSLAPDTPYYWQVVASDSYGEVTPGPVWDFTTGTSTGPTIRGYVRDAALAALAGVTVTFSGPFTITTGSDGYYAQAGLGGTVTVTVEAAGYTFSPWLDQVTVTGDVTHHVTAYPLASTPLLFSDGFESASYNLSGAWAVETDYEGRVGISSAYSHQGSYSLLLDDDTVGGFTSHASAILPLDLSGETEVKLGFWWRDFGDELSGGDGVFISDDDGATWHQVYSFTNSPTFTRTIIDLDEAVSAAPGGMTLNDQFLVKFQFYDNWPIPYDGYAIDDVFVYSDKYNTYLPLILRE
jgi:peptidyl-Asp metalloendopeptidase